MRDQLDNQIWDAGHAEFASAVDRGLAALAAAALPRLRAAAAPAHLIAASAALGLTLATFTGAAA